MIEFTFAIGDIHGCLDRLLAAIEACRRFAGGHKSTFILLGDYINRGPNSAGVIRFLRGWDGPEILICLKGNHEDMLLLAIQHPESAGVTWGANGGRKTLESYGVSDPSDLPAEDLKWIASLPLHYDDGQRFFVHAGIDPARALSAQVPEVMMYARLSYSEELDPGRFIVHGHTALDVAVPPVHPHRLNLDTGCGHGGRLSVGVFRSDYRGPVALIVDGQVFDVRHEMAQC